jgi:hypothetical protein
MGEVHLGQGCQLLRQSLGLGGMESLTCFGFLQQLSRGYRSAAISRSGFAFSLEFSAIAQIATTATSPVTTGTYHRPLLRSGLRRFDLMCPVPVQRARDWRPCDVIGTLDTLFREAIRRSLPRESKDLRSFSTSGFEGKG